MIKPFFTLSSLLVLFTLFFSPTLAAPASATEIDFTSLDLVIQGQMEKHGLPGVSVAIVEGDEITYLKGYGTAGPLDMTPQTRMFIGSQSKSFTALAVAQLAEQGKLDLNAPVRTYIPWFKIADENPSAKITVNHFLHHTSGLSESGYGIILPDNASSEEAVRSLAEARLSAPVGAQFQYFNLGYDVLTYIIETVTGERYADYIQTHVFNPLGMTSSTADPSSTTDLSWGYTRLFGFVVPMPQPVRDFEIGAGYIVSTAEDMARYAIAIKNNRAGLISPIMYRKMFNPGPGAYGMGWFIVDGGAKIFHGGANETFRTEVNIYPKRNRAFILLTNEGHQMDHFISAGQLTAAVEAVVLGNSPPPVSQGWSMRWLGWGFGVFVLALVVLHTRNYYTLFTGWIERTCHLSAIQKTLDVALSFIIPTVILLIIFTQVRAFYGYRFNLLTTMAYFRFGLPDVFILMLIGTLPDYVQGLIKLVWTLTGKNKPQ